MKLMGFLRFIHLIKSQFDTDLDEAYEENTTRNVEKHSDAVQKIIEVSARNHATNNILRKSIRKNFDEMLLKMEKEEGKR